MSLTMTMLKIATTVQAEYTLSNSNPSFCHSTLPMEGFFGTARATMSRNLNSDKSF